MREESTPVLQQETPSPSSLLPLLRVRQLTKDYREKGLVTRAVSNVSFDLYPGETLGLVGESGCGKSTIGKCLVRLTEPTSGELLFGTRQIHRLKAAELKSFRKEVSLIFQDPYASLNPRMTAGDIVGEPLDIHHLASGTARLKRIEELFELVGLPVEAISRFPHEFSGGQRQRIGIARALAASPRLLICDEPISALDVSVQAQIINLFKTLQQKMGLTMLFIAHDLRVVKYLCRRVAVMYRGQLVELAPSQALYENPLHPYTQALLSAIPIPDPQIERNRKRISFKDDRTRDEFPALREVAPDHWVAVE
jgi:ABC-type oligopeptide transport system ATPase subunit